MPCRFESGPGHQFFRGLSRALGAAGKRVGSGDPSRFLQQSRLPPFECINPVRDSGDGRSTTLWLAQDRGFVPLRIVQKEADGETVEMRITSLR